MSWVTSWVRILKCKIFGHDIRKNCFGVDYCERCRCFYRVGK